MNSQQNQKNWALFAVLTGLVLTIFVITLLRFTKAGIGMQ